MMGCVAIGTGANFSRKTESCSLHLLNLPRIFHHFLLKGNCGAEEGFFTYLNSIVNKQYPHSGWVSLKFAIFDVPKSSKVFTERIEKARRWFTEHPSPYTFVIAQIPVTDQADLQRELQRIEGLGGEGLIVRKPEALYKVGRSIEILKVKNYQNAEVTVVAHLLGKGKKKDGSVPFS